MMQHSFLSSDICYGYTLLFQESDSSFAPALADAIWENLTSDNNDRGPVGVGSLEFDTLRVEAGLPGYGNEMTGDGPKKDEDTSADDTYYAKSNPLELHLQRLINTEKGCYQGQEGIASMLKNPRGCPRQLYQVIFHDSENDFNGDAAGFGLLSTNNDELMNFQRLKKQAPQLSNGTRQPRPGDDIYVLGSNDFIQVGKISESLSCSYNFFMLSINLMTYIHT
jgi:glycine cleavage system aminomethyltransferase T